MLTLSVNFDTKNLTAAQKAARDLLDRKSSSTQRRLGERWRDVYRYFIKARFSSFKRGGGNWRPLALSTAAAKGHDDILSDSGQLEKQTGSAFDVDLTPGVFGIKIKYPKRRHPAGMLVGDLAAIHHFGMGQHARRILVAPPAALRRKMARILLSWYNRARKT